LAGVFCTTADIWVHYVFLTYTLTALLSPGDSWAKSEPGLDPGLWRANPTLESTYAWLIVGLQFTVYFFAGVNKLVFGWVPWTTGAALQNLAFDSSMREFARGVAVPLWIALPLCYVTLLQRLVVPFGFYVRRFRIWSVLILGTMHLGYAILMYVNLFPLIGISCLLMILPPSGPEPIREPAAGRAASKKALPAAACGRLRTWTLSCLALWLLVEPIRLTGGEAFPWENKFMVVPVWRMFADGGVTAGGKWQIVLQTNAGLVDATRLPLDLLPHSWRDRFYVDYVYHALIIGETGPGTLPDRLLNMAETLYRNRQLAADADPTILKSGFNIYNRNQ
jgi:vitamin K-dependent gamma-carboxylase-like protein